MATEVPEPACSRLDYPLAIGVAHPRHFDNLLGRYENQTGFVEIDGNKQMNARFNEELMNLGIG